jgi:hypothetical protein
LAALGCLRFSSLLRATQPTLDVQAKGGDEFSIRLTHNGSNDLNIDFNYKTSLDVQYLGK